MKYNQDSPGLWIKVVATIVTNQVRARLTCGCSSSPVLSCTIKFVYSVANPIVLEVGNGNNSATFRLA